MKFSLLVTPIGSVIVIVSTIAVQQTGVNISTELLLSILINVAIIALAFGKMQANIGYIKETMERIEATLTDDVKRIENRGEQIAKRYHDLANELLGRKLNRGGDA